MNKSTSKFIKNINKSSAKPIVFIDAFNGKRVNRHHWADELNVTGSYACIFIAVICFGCFAWWLAWN